MILNTFGLHPYDYLARRRLRVTMQRTVHERYTSTHRPDEFWDAIG
jgi:hypothetical protein